MSARTVTSIISGLLAMTGVGCINLDSTVYNARHCSTVGPATCEEETGWRVTCATCEQEYDWGKDYAWPDTIFDEGQTLREPEVVNRAPVSRGEGVELDFYFIPSHGEVPALADTTIVYQHGNYGGIEHYAPRLRILHELGYNLIVWDYRGYGKSMPETVPTGEELVADAVAIRDHIEGVAPDTSKLVIYGFSLGAIPSIEMALHKSPCAMMLESPFTSLEFIARSNTGTSLGGGFLSQGYFENSEKIKGYDAPLFMFIGDSDDLFGVDDIQRMYDSAASTEKELWIIPGAEHGLDDGTVETAGMGVYAKRLEGFLEAHAPGCVSTPE